MKSFVHLHTHSDFSFWRSTALVNDMVQTARAAGMTALALTDGSNLFAAPAFSKVCSGCSSSTEGNSDNKALKPIIGCDLGFPETGHPLSGCSGVEVQGGFPEDPGFGFRPVLLVQDDTGYVNLCSLLSALNGVGEERCREDPAGFLAERSKGLIALSGGYNGELSSHLAMGAWRDAKECASLYLDIFGKDRYWFELIPRGFRGWRRINAALLGLARELGIGVVATNDVRYTQRRDRRAFEIFVEAGRESGFSVQQPVFSGREAWLKSALEMDQMFGHVPGALENSLRIAEMVQFRLQDKKPALPSFGLSAIDTNRLLGILACSGLQQRYGQNPPDGAESRIAMELAMAEQIELAPWFLAAKEHVDLARKAGIGVGPGRGSLPGSLLAYCLSITDIDPLLYGLLPFQFFAAAARKLPSFDLDFEYHRRKELLESVATRWGKARVASIPTFYSLRHEAALEMASKGLDKPTNPFFAFLQRGGRRRKLLETAAILEARHIRVNLHAAGCVVAGEELEALVPLFRDRKTQAQVVQCPLDQLGNRGLSQFNFLGLVTLDEISRICTFVKADHPEFELASIPLDDELVWRRIGEGDTDDIFMLASEGFRTVLRDCCPTSLVELAVLNALYRPGTMSLIPVFRSRKLEAEPGALPHSALEPILRESYGLPVFNEQVTSAIAVLTGWEGLEAERQRVLLTSRRTAEHEVEALRESFITAMMAKNACSYTEAIGSFDFLRNHAPHGFLKAHSLAYCLIAYRQLWLRVHFPEFAADSGDTYTTSKGT